MPPQLNWACSDCGRVFSRRFSAERHVGNIHGGIGEVLPYQVYLISVLSGEMPRPARVVHAVRKDSSERRHPFDEFLELSKYAEITKVIDTLKANEIGEQEAWMQTLASLSQQQELREKRQITHMGFRDQVCHRCYSGYVQSIFEGNDAEQKSYVRYIDGHVCKQSERGLENLDSTEKISRYLTGRNEADDLLIDMVKKWGGKEKKLLPRPLPPEERDFVDLGEVKRGHWAYYIGQYCGISIKEPQIEDFLRKAHSTIGNFRFVRDGKVKMMRMGLFPENRAEAKEERQVEGEDKDKIIIAFKENACNQCFIAEALPIYSKGKKLFETMHVCDFKRIAHYKLKPKGADELRRLDESLPGILLAAVKEWLKGPGVLYAEEIKPVKDYVDLGSIDNNHWAMRAIRGETAFDDNELLDFLEKTKRTVGNFKIRVGTSEQFYTMYIFRNTRQV